MYPYYKLSTGLTDDDIAGIRALYVDPDLIQRQTPRVLDGARSVCEQIESVRSTRSIR